MVQFSAMQGVDVRLHIYANALIHKARNRALAEVRPDCTHVLFADDDMIPEKEALCRLLAHDLPVVSAVCTKRASPTELVARAWDEKSQQYLPLASINLRKVVSGDLAVGGAFLLIGRSALDRVIEYHLSGRDWIDENVRMLDLLKVRGENREEYRKRLEEIRRGRWTRDRCIALWDFVTGPDGLQLGEDIFVSAKFRRLGIPVAIDGQTWVGHIGEYPYGVWDLVDPETSQRQPDAQADPVLGGPFTGFNTTILHTPIGRETLPAYMRNRP
jgi:hypothetical protein